MDDVREILRRVLETRPEVSAAYLFGSTARGEDAFGSDLDVAVLSEEPLRSNSLDFRTRLAEDLARATGRRVDVVLLQEAPPTLVFRALRDGEILLCRDESARVRYETRALSRYYDLAYFRRQLDTGLLAEIREGRLLG